MRILSSILPLLFVILSIEVTAQTVVISQYIETNSGSTPKGIELWNPTTTDIDMSATPIVILKGTNGGTPAIDFTVDTGMLPAGAVIVVGTSDMASTCVGCFYEKAFTFNGDDALVIELDGVVTDVFGTPEMDPGSAWTGGGVSTRNSNIELNAGITMGDTDGWTDPSERFGTVDASTPILLTGFGVAPATAADCEVVSIAISNIGTCANVGDDDDNSNDTFTFDALLTYTSVPAGDIIIRYFSGATQIQAVQFEASAFPSPVMLNGNVANAIAGDLSATYEFVDDATCAGSFDALGTAPGPCSQLDCAITNLVISDLRCGNNGVSPLDAYATVTFDVVNGSGNYGSTFEGTSGGAGLNLATDGEVTFDIQLTVGTVTYGDVIDIQILDQADATCSATAVGIVVPDCSNACPLAGVPAPNNVTITNSSCQMVCTVGGGEIIAAVDNCPAGFTLEYSEDGGAYSAVAPMYNQEGPAQSITTRCTCEDDATIAGPESVAVVTVPGMCTIPMPPTADDITACEGGNTLITPIAAGGTASCAATVDLIITAAYDGPLPGGDPKGIELYVINDIADLSIYGVGSANNGGGSDGEEFTFPAVAATAGSHIYVSTEVDDFTAFFGFAPDYTTGAMGINGDDAVELFMNGTVIDVFGDINTDGNGQPWEYLDGWAYRSSETGESTTFNTADWTYSGANAWDGETSNATAASPMPIGTYTCTVGAGDAAMFNFYDLDPIDAAAILLAGPAVSYDPMTIVDDSPQSIFVTTVDPSTGCESTAIEVVVTALCCLTPTDFIVSSPTVSPDAFNNNGEWEDQGNGSWEANGFCGGGCAESVETWLLYGPLDMTGVTTATYALSATENFGTTDLNVLFTADEGVNNCPEEGNWTTLGVITDGGDYEYDLAAAAGSEIFIAIQYVDDGADGYSNWLVSNFELAADMCPVLGTPIVADVNAGQDMVLCGLAPATLAGAGTGMWSGGLGTFDDPTSPTATYTPDATEEGTTVTLSFSTTIGVCSAASDDAHDWCRRNIHSDSR